MTEPLLLAAALLFAAALYLLYRMLRMVRRLDRMLDCAIDGTFAADQFDESRLSRMESKLARFLSASVLSRQAIDADRRRIQSLIGDIAHQTRTPIANALLYASLLAEEPLSAQSHALAAQVVEQNEKLRFLIDALVKTSRLESGMVQVRPVRGPLADLFVSLAETFQPTAQAKGLTLSFAPAAGDALFDPKWTAEAIGNLIDNAIKYTPAGGHVRVSVARFQMFCAIEVADDGPGIPEADHAKIFTRFYRAQAVHDAPGVGVGLFLARQILTAQNGYIRVRSAPGQGAKFSAFLPSGD